MVTTRPTVHCGSHPVEGSDELRVYKQPRRMTMHQSTITSIIRITMFAKVSLMLLSVAVASAMASFLPHAPPPYGAPPHPTYIQKGRPYKFEYGVVDDYVGANYGHDETSDGELVQGSYYVALPDGRFQTVKYQADDAVGYVADVEYKGDAQHPPHYAPSVTFRPAVPPPSPAHAPPPTTTTAPPPPPPTTIPYEAED
ncbi:cuticle protein 7-like [Penaeus monodon]|uniref:cuticle protein 7-like n=1 Tax=Penaeus monodon TaxID=6687 RepID=UPI0018A79E79|nr:cuticle protein 7-like [Penaeus monodon]